MLSSTIILRLELTACQASLKAPVRRVNNWCHWFGKRKTVTRPLYDPARPLEPGLKGEEEGDGGGRGVGGSGEGKKQGRAGKKAISWLYCPGTRRLSLPIRFTCHNSRCCYDGEGKDVKSSKGNEEECRDLSCS